MSNIIDPGSAKPSSHDFRRRPTKTNAGLTTATVVVVVVQGGAEEDELLGGAGGTGLGHFAWLSAVIAASIAQVVCQTFLEVREIKCISVPVLIVQL